MENRKNIEGNSENKAINEKTGEEKNPYIDYLNNQFKLNDFSADVSHFDPLKASPGEVKIFDKIKNVFIKSWDSQIKTLCKIGSAFYFTEDSPLGYLRGRESGLVAGKVMEILSDGDKAQVIIERAVNDLAEPILRQAEKTAAEHNKAVEYLSDEEIYEIINKIADAVLGQMISLLMKVQNVSAVASLQQDMGAEEDFRNTAGVNYSRNNFDRKWNRYKTETNGLVSYEEIAEKTESALGIYDIDDYNLKNEDEAARNIELALLARLDDKQRQIYLMRKIGITQIQIAEIIGYKSHSAVSKQMKKIENIIKEVADGEKNKPN